LGARQRIRFTCKEVAEGKNYADIDGITWRNAKGEIIRNNARTPPQMDELPHVVDVYIRDLHIEDYFIGYLNHPYLSATRGAAANRAAPLPLAADHRRARLSHAVGRACGAEIAKAKEFFPQVKEFLLRTTTPSRHCRAAKRSRKASASLA